MQFIVNAVQSWHLFAPQLASTLAAHVANEIKDSAKLRIAVIDVDNCVHNINRRLNIFVYAK